MITLIAFTVIFYFLASLAYLLKLIFDEGKTEKVAVLLMGFGAILHTVLLVLRLQRNHYPFILGEGDFYYVAAWVVALVFLVMRRYYRLLESGFFFAPLALLLFILGVVRSGEYSFAGEALSNPWALVHILCMILAFSVFAVSFVVGVLFLVQEIQLKSRHPGRFLARFPSLETIDGIHYKALTIGFILLSVGILAGSALSKATEGRFFTGDLREIAAVATWIVYAVLLNIRIRSGWRGRKGIVLSLVGFMGVVLAFLWLGHRM